MGKCEADATTAEQWAWTYLCGCGDKAAGMAALRELLGVFRPRDEAMAVDLDALRRFETGHGAGVTTLLLWLLSGTGLAEHGSSVYGGWLTDLGRAVKAFVEGERHPDLVGPTRDALQDLGRPWIIENVVGAPLRSAITLCGLMFGLKVFRHRVFESSILLLSPQHPTHKGKRCGQNGYCSVIGNGTPHAKIRRHAEPGSHAKAKLCAAMGIDWMTIDQLTQAIPPAYTEFLGRQILSFLGAGADA